MLLKIPAQNIYFKDNGWHTARFYFAFADYEQPANTNFGVLRALNEFILEPGTGFDTHPHAEMEIISYCFEGELTHGDSLGNNSRLSGGDAQYLSAGSGITHHEMNDTQDRKLRFFQVWITPDEAGLKPKYRCVHHSQLVSRNILSHIATGDERDDVIQISQDANIYAAKITPEEPLVFINNQGRQTYLVCLVGKLLVNNLDLTQYDALKIWGQENLRFSSQEEAHILLIEMEEDH